MLYDAVLPASWWQLKLTPTQRLLHLLLMAQADRDGLCRVDSQPLAQQLHQGRVQVVQQVKALEAMGVLGLYTTTDGTWAWLPHVSEYQPTRGSLARERVLALPAPPKEVVLAALARLWGRDVQEQEARAACPRAWGRTGRATGSTTPPAADVLQVWEEWRQRQDRPGACALGAIRPVIEGALRQASAEQLCALVRYAYEADEPGPAFWRGANTSGMTYLGLDNLLVAKKLPKRLQDALRWVEARQAQGAGDDGTDYGPLARYR